MGLFLIHEEREMITCKEDLYGTYVLLVDSEAAKIYVDLINEFGISNISIGENRREDAIEVHKAKWSESGWDASLTRADRNGLDADSRRLTLFDLKPRTRPEYVKVTESIFDLKEEFERGELYQSMNDDSYERIAGEVKLGELFGYGLIYRRIETPITEREEFIETYAWAVQDDVSNIEGIAGMLFDSGKFKLTDKE